MKIIGTSIKGFIIEAEADELSNLMGYSNDFNRTYDRRDGQVAFKIGDKIPIKKMYDRLYTMANMGKQLSEIAGKLKAASDFVDSALPTIQKVNKGEEEEKSV